MSRKKGNMKKLSNRGRLWSGQTREQQEQWLPGSHRKDEEERKRRAARKKKLQDSGTTGETS